MVSQPKSFPPAVVVATAADVEAVYGRLAAALQAVIDTEDCILLGVMVGGMLPMARLASLLHGDYRLDYCQVSRYRGGESRGERQRLNGANADGLAA